MKISTYLQKIYRYCENPSNQAEFTSEFFVNAGSDFLFLSTSDYSKKIFNGSKPLSKGMRDSFSSINIEMLKNYLLDILSEHKIRNLLSEFSIPPEVEENKAAMCMALVEQFQLIITSENEVEDIVALAYQKYLIEPTFNGLKPKEPLYPGDSVYVLKFTPKNEYTVSTYDRFTHTWEIRNAGNQTWRERKLVFVNKATVRPKAEPSAIEIPYTPPGKDIKISISFDARGIEGNYVCIWEMQDINNNNCFPNREKLFDITINIKFLFS